MTVRTNLPAAIRLLRLRRGWRQRDLATRVGLSRELVSRIERGDLDGVTIRAISLLADGLEATVDVQLKWRGEQLDRLLDATHAAIQEETARQLSALGWMTRPEVSFNHFGDRGRVDLVAFHFATRTLLVVEIKSAIGDVQDLLGRLNVKVRLGRIIGREAGIGPITTVVPALVIADTRAVRRVIALHDSLFQVLPVRGRKALAWIRRPTGVPPAGLLWFAKRPDSRQNVFNRRAQAPKRPDSHGV